ncbi:hypothetical protein DL96DRAFT_1675277 [Flagelloscypha sp. PMI_526]|nr:hypothetical protein DL96DRAFT_1675277 [Flagelloscypha sp. PMI_526]
MFKVSIAFHLSVRQATLDQAATAEAQQFDATATRAFTATEIKTSDGQCFTIDPLGGDFRQNLIPVTTSACTGAKEQQWDIITAGKHNNRAGFANVVSTLTNGCLNFDPRRAAGNQVLLFSCGGRADGGGEVTDSQLFPFTGGAGPLELSPANTNGATCLVAAGGKVDQAGCDNSAAQQFTLGADGAATGGATAGDQNNADDNASATSETPAATSAATTSSAAEVSATPAAPAASAAGSTTTLPTVTLDEAATAEAQQRDDTATRAFSDATLKTSDGKCLQAVSGTGDFRNNLVPITIADCDGSDGQKWDLITSGKHDNVDGAALIVNTAIQGCMNLDLRRQPGNQVLLFSCGGRADGEGLVTDSQLWKSDGQATNPIESASTGGNAGKCLVNNNGRLDVVDCTGDAAQDFTFA